MKSIIFCYSKWWSESERKIHCFYNKKEGIELLLCFWFRFQLWFKAENPGTFWLVEMETDTTQTPLYWHSLSGFGEQSSVFGSPYCVGYDATLHEVLHIKCSLMVVSNVVFVWQCKHCTVLSEGSTPGSIYPSSFSSSLRLSLVRSFSKTLYNKGTLTKLYWTIVIEVISIYCCQGCSYHIYECQRHFQQPHEILSSNFWTRDSIQIIIGSVWIFNKSSHLEFLTDFQYLLFLLRI